MANGKKKVSRWTPEQILERNAVLQQAIVAFRDGTAKKASNPKERGWCTVLLVRYEMQTVLAKLRQAEGELGITHEAK